MAYSKRITPSSPALIIIAVDQSGSMNEAFTNHSMIVSKSEIASMIASAMIDELVCRSRHADRNRRYFDISVFGYSKIDAYPLLCDSWHPVPITLFEQHEPKRLIRTIEYLTPDNHLRLIEEPYSEWIEPKAAGPTPMLEMLDRVTDMVREWCANRQNQDSFPPIVFNITDGVDEMEYTTLHKRKVEQLKQIGTNDGNTIVINVCIDSCPKEERLNFPSLANIPSQHPAKLLVDISTILPECFATLHKRYNTKLSEPPFLSLCYNAAALDIIPMLPMGVD